MRARMIVLSVALVASTVALSPTATAQATLEVEVGTGLLAEDVPALGMRFYAPTLKVHQGDTVNFDLVDFHTATLLPADEDVEGWVAENTGGIDKPWGTILSDPDEAPASHKFSSRAAFPNVLDCGGGGEEPCAYDGSGVLNSGIFDPEGLLSEPGLPSFAARIDAAPGSRVWFVCLVHPNMRGRIDVVDGGQPTTEQAEIDDYRERKTAQDLDAAAATHAALSSRTFKHRTPSGKIVNDVFVGFDGTHYSLAAMYPDKMKVTKGAKVRFRFDQLVHESHTASLPHKTSLNVAFNSFFPPVCDGDGDGVSSEEPVGNMEGSWEGLCAGGVEQIEFDLDPDFMPEAGNGVFRGNNDFESSGVRGFDTVRFDSYDVKMAATSGKKPFKFVCLIHPFMRGKIKVTPQISR